MEKRIWNWLRVLFWKMGIIRMPFRAKWDGKEHAFMINGVRTPLSTMVENVRNEPRTDKFQEEKAITLETEIRAYGHEPRGIPYWTLLRYAQFVIRGRWVELEIFILGNMGSYTWRYRGVQYVTDVIGGYGRT